MLTGFHWEKNKVLHNHIIEQGIFNRNIRMLSQKRGQNFQFQQTSELLQLFRGDAQR